MLTYHRTSILTSTAQTVVNTVNTVGVMGKGLAAAFKARYPDMFKTYQGLCRSGKFDIGMLWLWKGPDQWVLNFPTKKHWRHPSKLSYIEAGLEKFVSEYEHRGIREISFPRLGCGNGGLEWANVRPLMERFLAPLPIPIYIHDFEKDIGVPEHHEMKTEDFERSFDKFIEQTRKVLAVHDGAFATVVEKTPFRASWNEEGFLELERDNKQAYIPSDELYELWSLLLRGPVTQNKVPGTGRDWAYYLFSVLAHLPYVRPIEIGQQDDSSTLAIELTDQSVAQSVPNTLERKQGSFEWA